MSIGFKNEEKEYSPSEKRSIKRVSEGRRPWPVFDPWGSFGGISEHSLRGRILSVVWFVVFLTSLPAVFLINNSQPTLVEIIVLILVLGPGLRLWYTDWDNLDKKWLKINYREWLHLALIFLIIEITALNVIHNTLAFSLDYFYVLGYIAYFYSLRTLIGYVIVIICFLTAPLLFNTKFSTMWALVFIGYAAAVVLISLFVYWQQFRLKNMNRRLRSLNKLIRELTDVFTPEEKHAVFISNMREVFQPQTQIIWNNLHQPATKLKYVKDVFLDAVPSSVRINLLQEFGEKQLKRRIPWNLLSKRSKIIRFVSEENEYLARVLETLGCTQIMSMPVRTGPEQATLGFAWLGTDSNLGFTTEDFVYFQACVREYAHSLETYKAEEEAIRAHEEADMAHRLADTLQENLLPTGDFSIPELEVGYAASAATTLASVGGDFYDFLNEELEEHGLGIVIGDTVGHGLEAAKLTALIKYTIRTLVHKNENIQNILTETNAAVNKQKSEHLKSGDDATIFTTISYAYYDKKEHTLRINNSGHYMPIIYSKHYGAFRPPLGLHKPPLGAYEEQYRNTFERITSVCLPADTTICFYTDGVVEARSYDKQEFGTSGVETSLKDLHHRPVGVIGEEILKRVQGYTNGQMKDDATVVVIRPQCTNQKLLKKAVIKEIITAKHLTDQMRDELISFAQATVKSYEAPRAEAKIVIDVFTEEIKKHEEDLPLHVEFTRDLEKDSFSIQINAS